MVKAAAPQRRPGCSAPEPVGCSSGRGIRQLVPKFPLETPAPHIALLASAKGGSGSTCCSQGLLQPARQLERRESLAGVEIVLTGLIDDAQEAFALGCGVPERDIDLS